MAFRSNRQAPKELVQLVDDFVTQRLVRLLPVASERYAKRKVGCTNAQKSSARGKDLFTTPGSPGHLMLLVYVNVGECWYVSDIHQIWMHPKCCT